MEIQSQPDCEMIPVHVRNTLQDGDLRRPVQNLRDHIAIVKWVGVLLMVCLCMSTIGIVVSNVKAGCALPLDRELIGGHVVYTHDYSIHDVWSPNLTVCVFIDRCSFTEKSTNYTVCITEDGHTRIDININGSFVHYSGVDQWRTLKTMVARIDASLEKAETYSRQYVSNDEQ
jgi:hypothetical protein